MTEDRECVVQHLDISDKVFVSKRRRNMVVFFLRELAAGIYFSAILPSLWLYLQKFNSGKLWYGLVISVYQVVGMILLPFVGRLYDITKQTKAIITAMNVFEMLGALIYSLSFSPWFPLIGRIISGVGGAASGVINGEVATTTQSKARVSAYAILEMGWMVGILFGPPFALLFKKIDFRIGQLQVDFANAPGMLGAVLWILMEVCNRLMTSNLALDYIGPKPERIEDYLPASQSLPIVDEIDVEESVDTISDQTESQEAVDTSPSIFVSQRTRYTVRYLLGVVCQSEILSIFAVYSGILIGIVSMDVVIPLITQVDFGWSTVGTSVAYLMAAAFVAIVYGLLHIFGGKVSEIWCLGISILLNNTGCLIFIPIRDINASFAVKILMFAAAVGFGCTALPVCQVSTTSILSKVVSPELQGYIQSIHSLVFRLASIIAPLFGSFAFEHMYLGYGYLMLISVFTGLWFVVSLDVLKMRMNGK